MAVSGGLGLAVGRAFAEEPSSPLTRPSRTPTPSRQEIGGEVATFSLRVGPTAPHPLSTSGSSHAAAPTARKIHHRSQDFAPRAAPRPASAASRPLGWEPWLRQPPSAELWIVINPPLETWQPVAGPRGEATPAGPVKSQPPPGQPLVKATSGASAGGTVTIEMKQTGPVKRVPPRARNEPCACGSGRPVKRCHGKPTKPGLEKLNASINVMVVAKPAGEVNLFSIAEDGIYLGEPAAAARLLYNGRPKWVVETLSVPVIRRSRTTERTRK